MKLKIDEEFRSLIPALTDDELAGLERDLKRDGCLDSLKLWDGILIDGHNRYEICEAHSISYDIENIETIKSRHDAKLWMLDNQRNRRNLTESQRAMLAEQYATLERRDNQHASIDASTQSESAKRFNVSRPSVQRARKVRREGTPELAKAVTDGKVAVSTAADVATLPKEEQARIVAMGEDEILAAAKKVRKKRAAVNAAKQAETATREVILPKGKFSTIVIDPPWPMQKIERDERPAQVGFDYPTMTEEELKLFDVPSMAADDCHLYLWTTHKFLPMAFRLAEHWGFNYECLLTWVKNVGFTPFSWMRSTEHILFCRKGGLKLLNLGKRLDFSAKVREHSRKPDEFYELVCEVSPGPYIDVFSREARAGFAQLGNELGKF